MTRARWLALAAAALLLTANVRAVEGTESRITDTFGTEEQPHIHGDRLVWADTALGDSENIWMYDFATGRRTQLSFGIGTERWPRVWGNRVVWMEPQIRDQGGQVTVVPSVRVYNLLSGDSVFARELAGSGFPNGTGNFPDIYGEFLVWQNTDVDQIDIYAMNLGSGLVYPLTNDNDVQQFPEISGNWVVWERNTVLGPELHDIDLFVTNLQSSTAVRVPVATSPDWDEQEATIHGNTLVYTDFRNDPDNRSHQDPSDNGDLYMIDLSPLLAGQPLGPAQPLVVRNGSQEEPHLYENRLVWRDFGANSTIADIWTMDLRDRNPEVLVDGPADMWEVQIDGNRVVWSDKRSDANEADGVEDWDIRAFCIGESTCGVFPEESPFLVIFLAVLVIAVVVAGGFALREWLRHRAAPAEAERAGTRRGKARPPKGKGPRPKKARQPRGPA